MKTYNIDYTTSSTSTILGQVEDYLTNAIAPIFNGFNNLTFVGIAASGNWREAVFQIKDYTSMYLAVARGSSNSHFNNDGGAWFNCYFRKTADLTTANTGLTSAPAYGGSYNVQVSTASTGMNFKQNFYAVTDENNNLLCTWRPRNPSAILTNSESIFFAEDEDGRDLACYITAPNRGHICVMHLDDPDNTYYYVPTDATVYNNSSKLVRKNWMPICTTSNVNTMVNNIYNKYIRIFNTDLGANENQDNEDSAAIRKLIKIGNKNYRQVVSTLWVEDPLGDEEPILITNS